MAEEFAPESLQTFDGKEWGGVRLEETTRDEFKRRFKTKGGKFVRAEATVVSTPSRLPWEVQLLQDANKGDARITGFYLTFRDSGSRLDRLGLDKNGSEEWFAENRFSDWSVLAYPKKGIAFVVQKDREERISSAVLTTPSRLQRILDKFSKTPSRVNDLRDAFERLRRDVEIGSVYISLSKKDISPRNEDRFLENQRSRVTRDIDRGDLRYRRGADGVISGSISIKFKEDKNDNEVSANLSLNASNERGKITASGYGRYSLDRNRRRAEDDVDYASERALRDALDTMLRAVDSAIRDQKPPTLDEMRDTIFIQLIDSPTK